ncbi:hypothetical protein [Burkholderia ubonensis]|uniref:hypothetical protein n=1 Tax=Burkholderia ubonensis TaxID=101571 RepID=UPI0012F75162|nr:hypothetical protein [Burkholderia ubonensis]
MKNSTGLLNRYGCGTAFAEYHINGLASHCVVAGCVRNEIPSLKFSGIIVGHDVCGNASAQHKSASASRGERCKQLDQQILGHPFLVYPSTRQLSYGIDM